MRLLLVGGGGREHALAWRIRQSAHCSRLFALPGNGGIESIAECVPIAPKAIPEIVHFAQQQRIDLVVVGPESPLIAGLADALAEVGIPCFGPRRAPAQLEGSKAFAKQVMAQAGVPTAPFAVFDTPELAKAYLREQFALHPMVVKADGEALGKGVFVCETLQEALEAVAFLMEQRGLGEAGTRIVIEQRLFGREASLLFFADHTEAVPMPPVRDYKRAFDGDRGPNTGGMGSFTPPPDITAEIVQRVREQIAVPTLRLMAERGTPYQGVLYAGLMLVENQPYTLEFNCRFGDPETQTLMPLLQTDLVELMMAVVEGRLQSVRPQFSNQSAVCVVLASGGYPSDYRTGFPIEGIHAVQQLEGVYLFHAGTRLEAGRYLTAGGRVLNVVGVGDTLAQARQRAYNAVEKLYFEGMHYRTDIANL